MLCKSDQTAVASILGSMAIFSARASSLLATIPRVSGGLHSSTIALLRGARGIHVTNRRIAALLFRKGPHKHLRSLSAIARLASSTGLKMWLPQASCSLYKFQSMPSKRSEWTSSKGFHVQGQVCYICGGWQIDQVCSFLGPQSSPCSCSCGSTLPRPLLQIAWHANYHHKWSWSCFSELRIYFAYNGSSFTSLLHIVPSQMDRLRL